MAFKLVVSNSVRVAVNGELAGEDGARRPFAFDVVANRLTESDMRPQAADDDRTVADWLAARITDWSGVLGADDRPLPFSQDALRSLLDVAGLPHLVLQAYVETCGARAREKK